MKTDNFSGEPCPSALNTDFKCFFLMFFCKQDSSSCVITLINVSLHTLWYSEISTVVEYGPEVKLEIIRGDDIGLSLSNDHAVIAYEIAR
jgi:hypothetical protein